MSKPFKNLASNHPRLWRELRVEMGLPEEDDDEDEEEEQEEENPSKRARK